MNPINWIEQTARDPLTEKPVKLLSWQKEVLENMYDDNCNVKKPHLFIGFVKKIGKSALGAMICAYRMAHRRNELYTIIASSEEQAFVVYRSFIELFKFTQFFSDLKVMRNRILHKTTGSELRVLTSSPGSTHGLKPALVLADEIMSFDNFGAGNQTKNSKNFKQLEILEDSMSLSRDPQKIYLTNVPASPSHPSLQLLKECKKDKKNWQVVEFKAPQNLKWSNKKAWSIANPFYREGYQQVIDFYNERFKQAKTSKNKENAFCRWLLGWGTLSDQHTWMDYQNLQWIEKEREKILNDREIEWAVGFDLSLQGPDSTSWVLAGWKPLDDDESPLNEQKLYLYGNIYYGCIDKKQSLIKENIINWHNAGHLVYQQTDVIKQNPIIQDFKDFMNSYPHIKEDVRLIFDPALADPWRDALQDEYVTVARAYRPREITPAIRNMQRMAETKSIHILESRNPAIEWQTQCGFVNELSRNYCMLQRMNRNNQLNVDYWSAALLALSELLKPRARAEGMVI